VSTTGGFAIEAEGLVKRFGATQAVAGIDLCVRPGTVYGFLGPNGAGKTTVIRILATLLRPDAGTARIFGHDVVREARVVRSLISLTGQSISVDEDLTGLENLVLVGRLLGLGRHRARDRAGDLLDAFGLAGAADRQVRLYSGGMRRRIDVAASLVVTPDLVFLDEPTTGLDPRSRNQVWDIVGALVAQGTTVLLTTQNLEEADALSDRIAVVDRGRVIAEGTSAELKSSVGSGALCVRVGDPERREDAERVLRSTLGVPTVVGPDAHAVTVTVSDTGRAAQALAALAHAHVPVTDFSLGRPSLDDVFLALTGHATGGPTPPSPDSALLPEAPP
jgi:ABC-2 type transport system ATP-binding protein